MASSPKIDDLRKKFEENPRRYFAPLANEYRKAGDIEQAIAICREYLPQQPGHMSGHIVFGQALFEARQLDEAKTVFETALSLDPENLIALKHLGDISLMAGDTEAAKTWYKRVLEADPRNEETQAQLASLEGAGKPPAAPTPVVPVESLSTAKTTPLPAGKPAASSSAPTVVMKAMGPPPRPGHPPMAPAKPAAPPAPPPAPTASGTATSPTAEIRLEGLTHGAEHAAKPSAPHTDMPATLVMETPHGVTPVAANDTPVVTPTVGLEATSMGGTEPPAMDSFSLEGLETTSLAASPPPPAALPALDFGAPAAAPEVAPAAALPATVEIQALDLDLPAAAPAPPPVPEAAAAATIDLDFGTPAPAAPVVLPTPAAAVEAPMLDLADFAPPPTSAPAVPETAIDIPAVAAEPTVPVAEIDLGFAVPVAAAPEPPELATDVPMAEAPADAAPAQASSPFVTETMAELYLQQGHRDEALRVYRALLDQKPGDTALRAKVASLEASPIPVPIAGGPTIREVLVLIAQRRPGYKPEGSNGVMHAEPPAAEPAYAVPAEPAPAGGSQWAADTLGALWGSSEPDAADEGAALMLATAFSDLNGMENGGTPGLDLSAAAAAAAPARPSVAVPAPTVPPSSFSFDKFFSQRVTAEHAAQASGPAAQPESKEDVAQFTRWLEGLKQQ